MKIDLAQIIPDPDQPRKTFKEEALQELQASYNTLGLIQPITVRPHNGKYMIVVGERRYQAALLNGQTEIECIVREDIEGKIAREMQFAENSQQEDISPLELGKAFLEHRKKYEMEGKALAKVIGLSEATITQYERLNLAAKSVQSYIQSGKLDASTAYEISTIKDEKRQSELADFAVEEDLNRDTVRKIVPIVKTEPNRSIESIVTEVKYGISPEDRKILEQAKPPSSPMDLVYELDTLAESLYHKLGKLEGVPPAGIAILGTTLKMLQGRIQEVLSGMGISFIEGNK